MNKNFTRLAVAALAGVAMIVQAGAATFNHGGDSFHDVYRRNNQPTPRAANIQAKITAAENDAIRLAQRIAALQRPTITVYSNIKAPDPAPAPAPVVTAAPVQNVINITDSNVVIGN